MREPGGDRPLARSLPRETDAAPQETPPQPAQPGESRCMLVRAVHVNFDSSQLCRSCSNVQFVWSAVVELTFSPILNSREVLFLASN